MNTRSLFTTTGLRWRADLLHAAAAFVIALSLPGCLPTVIPGTCNGGVGRNVNLCLGFPSGSPTIDGNIKSDSGWTNAFRYILGEANGTSVAHVIVHGVRSSNTLYLGFEVHNDAQFNVNDAIVLAFDPDGTAANRRRIHIYPVFNAGAGQGGIPQKVDYWKGSENPDWTNPNTAPVNPTPTWLTNNIRVSSEGPPNVSFNHYYVEVGIPIVANATDPGINLPSASDDFGFYFTVVDAVTTSGVTNHVSENSWPLDAKVGAFLEETPTPDKWGNGTLGMLANGVSAERVFTNQSPDTEISLTLPNTFYATVKNNMVTAGGAQATARNVRAEFRIRNYGIPSLAEWDLLPSTPNPTPFKDIAGNSTNFQTDWTLNPTQQMQYGNSRDQCTRVEITSNGPNTLIVNKRAMANMHFVDAQSPFNEKARVGVRGYRLPEGQREHEFLLTEFRYNTRRADDWKSELSDVEPLPVGGAARQYVLRIPASQEDGADVSARVTPPNVKIPHETVKLPPGSRGDARIRVEPGNIVTVFSGGSVILRKGQGGPGGRPIGPNGQSLQQGREAAADRGKYLLNAADAPETRVGAVIASPDGFPGRSFVLGRATTFQVPPGVTEISFGINDTAEGSKMHAGEGFSLDVIQTPADEMYRHTTTLLDRRKEREVTVLSLGQNLPTWIVCGQRKTGRTLTIRGVTYDRYENVGCFGSIVKSIKGQ